MADLAQEVVQEAQRERIVGLAVDDARVRAAEPGAGGGGVARGSGPWLALRAAALTMPRQSRRVGAGRR